MNTYGGQASTDVVASAFPGAKVVKTLNQLPAKLLAQDPADNGGRRVVFVSSNDEGR
jgi:predicted dinucleotide-binding enzyme